MKTIIFILLVVFPIVSKAQNESFKLLRYDENYSSLKKDTVLSLYRKLKYQPLNISADSYISFGGEVRYQYFWYQNPEWGEESKDHDGFVLTRFLGHMDIHSGNRLRLFTQLQSSLVTGNIGQNSAVDENTLDLHQFFFDILLFDKKQEKLTMRLGRQEFSYGSQRLISVREAPNNRQAFDAAKWIYARKSLKADVFYSNYVVAKQQVFDDKFLNENNKLWGTYLVLNQIPFINNVDFYYLGLQKKHTVFDDGTGRETRHSIGTRIWKNTGNLTYDIEAVYQFGKLAEQNISAWTLSSNTSYQFENVFAKPTLGLKTELISGDDKYGDGKIHTFNPLYPKGAYFGLAALIGPYNLTDLHPYIELELTKKLTLQADYDLFWRMSRNDGLYAVNGSLLYSGKNLNAKYIGNQLGTELVFQPNPFLFFRAEFTWFNSGKFLKQAGTGKDILMAGATIQLRF